MQKDYLLVDGYNIIFAWEELKALAATISMPPD
ncbi:MAG: NYN domain-containing protein [Lachnospiraceae bacterium]